MEKTPNLIEFDIRGQHGSSTLLAALKEIDNQKTRIKEGTIKLLIRTDNRYCTMTIPHAVHVMGYGVKVTSVSDHFVIVIENNT